MSTSVNRCVLGTILFALVVPTPNIFADPVSRSQAVQAAAAFIKTELRSGPEQSPLRGRSIFSQGATETATANGVAVVSDHEGVALAYFVPLEPEGFIIVSADDSLKAILDSPDRRAAAGKIQRACSCGPRDVGCSSPPERQ